MRSRSSGCLMVRFSDLLGGGRDNGERPDAVPRAIISEGLEPAATDPGATDPAPADPAATDPYAALASDLGAEPETPEDLLARLAEYAAMRRPLPPEPTAAVPRPDVDLEQPSGDDLLPRKAR